MEGYVITIDRYQLEDGVLYACYEAMGNTAWWGSNPNWIKYFKTIAEAKNWYDGYKAMLYEEAIANCGELPLTLNTVKIQKITTDLCEEETLPKLEGDY